MFSQKKHYKNYTKSIELIENTKIDFIQIKIKCFIKDSLKIPASFDD